MAGTRPTRPQEPAARGPGAVVAGRFRLDAPLGHGGMGVVWGATQLVLDRPVALKLVRPEDLGDPARRDALLDEARAAARVSHPHLATVFDAGLDDDGSAFLAMERLDGEDLRALLARRGRLPPDEAIGLLLPALDALAAVHGAGLVHRDVKPENLQVTRASSGSLRCTLVDFGIAAEADLDTDDATGTLAYLSPERLRGGATVGPRDDLWSFGVVLYEALAGRAPFVGAHRQALVGAIERGVFPPLRDLAAEVSPTLAALVQRSLAHDPAQRPALARALHDELAGLRARPSRRRFAALAAVAVVVPAAWFLRPAPEPAPRPPERAVATSPPVVEAPAPDPTPDVPAPAGPVIGFSPRPATPRRVTPSSAPRPWLQPLPGKLRGTP